MRVMPLLQMLRAQWLAVHRARRAKRHNAHLPRVTRHKRAVRSYMRRPVGVVERDRHESGGENQRTAEGNGCGSGSHSVTIRDQ